MPKNIEDVLKNGVKFAKAKRSFTPPGQEPESEEEELDENGNPKKPKPNDPEADPKPSKSKVKILGSISTPVVNIYERTTDFFNKLSSDAVKDLDKYLNKSDRRAGAIRDLGDVKLVTNVLQDTVKYIADQLAKLPNALKLKEFLTPEQYDNIMQLKEIVNSTHDSASLGDLMSMLLTARTHIIRLMSTYPLLEADPGLLDDYQFIAQTLWDDDEETTTHNPAAPYDLGKADQIGDNFIQPDLTIVKPLFFLLVDDKLRNELYRREVAPNIIEALGNFTIPSARWDGELNSVNTLGLEVDGFNEPHEFHWSENGTPQVNTLTIEFYRRNTAVFLSQIDDRYNTAQKANIREYDYTLATVHTLTLWLNGAYKAIVENNMDFAEKISSGIQFDKERLMGVPNASLAAKFLLETSNGDGSRSPFETLMYMLNSTVKSVISRKLPYDEFAYKFVQKEFQTLTFSIDDVDSKYFIGSNLIGNHKVKINILPKLYMPVNLLEATPVDFIDHNHVVHRVPNAYLSKATLNRAFYVKDRDVVYDSIVVNFSFLHYMFQLDEAAWDELVLEFTEGKILTAYNKTAIPLQTVLESSFTERRSFSAIPSHYYKDILLGKTPTVFIDGAAPVIVEPEGGFLPGQEPADVHNRWNWPIIDMAFRKNVVQNHNGFGDAYIDHPFMMGDIFRAILNFHIDFSWIESAMVYLSAIQRGLYCGPAYAPVAYERAQNITNAEHLAALVASLNTIDNGNIEARVYSAAAGLSVPFGSFVFDNLGEVYNGLPMQPAGNYRLGQVTWASLFRNHYYTQLYALKEKEGKTSWFNSFDKVSPSIKPSNISMMDVYDAFHYVPHTFAGHYYIVDNKAINSGRVLFPVVERDANQILSFNGVQRFMRDGKTEKITEASIRQSLLDAETLDHGLLLFDGRAANVDIPSIELEPVIIPLTDKVGYEIDQEVTHEQLLNIINDLVYVKSNFMPMYINYSIILPSNSRRSPLGVVDNGAYTPQPVLANNVKFSTVVSHLLLAFGTLSVNVSESLRILGTAFGIQVNDNVSLFPNNDAIFYDMNLEVEYLQTLQNEAAAHLGWLTSWRYGTSLIYATSTSYNVRFFMGSIMLPGTPAVSMLKSKKYLSWFKSVPFNGAGMHVQTLPLSTERCLLIPLIEAVGAEVQDWDIRVGIKPIEVIRTLGLEDVEFSYVARG